jgi:membrane protein YqaA with SNARE-associated domain
VHHWLRHLAHLAYLSGALGVLIVSSLDSSFLVLPLGNDILLIALSAHNPQRAFYYILAATTGSILGSWLTAWLSRKGERGLRRRMSRKRLEFVESQIKKHGAWALGIASLMPPPFPFTTFVAVSSAFDYPRQRLLAVVGSMRFLRFVIEGALAAIYGRWIISLVRSDRVEYVVLIVAILSIAASAYSIYGWMNKGRARKRVPAPAS